MHEPYTHLTGLTLVDLEDLLEDIRVYMQLEKEVGGGGRWWVVIVVGCGGDGGGGRIWVMRIVVL